MEHLRVCAACSLLPPPRPFPLPPSCLTLGTQNKMFLGKSACRSPLPHLPQQLVAGPGWGELRSCGVEGVILHGSSEDPSPASVFQGAGLPTAICSPSPSAEMPDKGQPPLPCWLQCCTGLGIGPWSSVHHGESCVSSPVLLHSSSATLQAYPCSLTSSLLVPCLPQWHCEGPAQSWGYRCPA